MTVMEELEDFFTKFDTTCEEIIKMKSNQFESLVDTINSESGRLNEQLVETGINELRDELIASNKQLFENEMSGFNSTIRIIREKKDQQITSASLLDSVHYVKNVRFRISDLPLQIFTTRLLVNFKYEKDFNHSIYKKLKYINVFNEFVDINLSNFFTNKHIIPLNKREFFTYDFDTNTISIVNKDGNQILERKLKIGNQHNGIYK